MTKANRYDNLTVDIDALHRNCKLSNRALDRSSLYLVALLLKAGLWCRLVDAGFVRGWFNEFHSYWVEVLGGRPLSIHDFFYLYANYRRKFQDVELNENDDRFVETWQLPRNLYLIFGSVYKYAQAPMSYFPFSTYIHNSRRILEYGCGVAPITYSAAKFGGYSATREFTLVDLPGFTFHFAKWRLSGSRNIHFVDIDPKVLPELQGKYDLVFLMTVLEHLSNPIEVVDNITFHLQSGGWLIFDFILGDGSGLDTRSAISQRPEFLNYINENYIVEQGSLEVEKSMGLTIARRR